MIDHFSIRRGYSLLLAWLLVVSLAACGEGGENRLQEPPTVFQAEDLPQASQTPNAAEGTVSQENILIAYFSLWDNAPWEAATDSDTSASVVVSDEAVGTNAYVARMIQEAVGGDLHAILTADSYPASFDEVVDINHQEQSRTIASTVENMQQYDTVFIGYPVWATTVPQAVQTFLGSYDFSGKTVIPFCTHGGYGAGSSFSTVAQLADGAEILAGLAIQDKDVSTARDTVTQWVQGLGIVGRADGREETEIRMIIGDTEVDGVLYHSDMAEEFLAQLPQTISMSNYGGREIYGGISQEIPARGEGQRYFADGDITYCPANNTVALFYSQSSHPNLTMEVYPIGKVTSDLSVFPALPSRVNITFEIAE